MNKEMDMTNREEVCAIFKELECLKFGVQSQASVTESEAGKPETKSQRAPQAKSKQSFDYKQRSYCVS